MIRGVFSGNIPIISIPVAWGQSVQKPFFILDTGFTGDLKVPYKIASELGLQSIGVTPIRFADGKIQQVPAALAFALMENTKDYIEVIVSEGPPLAGIGLLSKFEYKAILDCKYKTVVLEKAV